MTGIEIVGIGIGVFLGNLVLIHNEDRIAEFGNIVSGLWSGLCTLLDNCCSNLNNLRNIFLNSRANHSQVVPNERDPQQNPTQLEQNTAANKDLLVKLEEPALDRTKETAEQLGQRSAVNAVDEKAALIDGTQRRQGCNLRRRGKAVQRQKRRAV